MREKPKTDMTIAEIREMLAAIGKRMRLRQDADHYARTGKLSRELRDELRKQGGSGRVYRFVFGPPDLDDSPAPDGYMLH